MPATHPRMHVKFLCFAGRCRASCASSADGLSISYNFSTVSWKDYLEIVSVIYIHSCWRWEIWDMTKLGNYCKWRWLLNRILWSATSHSVGLQIKERKALVVWGINTTVHLCEVWSYKHTSDIMVSKESWSKQNKELSFNFRPKIGPSVSQFDPATVWNTLSNTSTPYRLNGSANSSFTKNQKTDDLKFQPGHPPSSDCGNNCINIGSWCSCIHFNISHPPTVPLLQLVPSNLNLHSQTKKGVRFHQIQCWLLHIQFLILKQKNNQHATLKLTSPYFVPFSICWTEKI